VTAGGLALREPTERSGERDRNSSPGTVYAGVQKTTNLESIVKMSDRMSLRRIFDLAATLVLLVGGAAGVVYAVAIATTLQELRTLEPITLDGHPDLEVWRCPAAAGSSVPADAESKPRSTSAVHAPTNAERSATCAPAARQARPQ
jgi:hypothetical protein